MDFFDKVIKFSKALILLSIAIFFVRCSLGALVPDVNINGLKDGDRIVIEVIEGEEHGTVTITKNGEDLLIIEDSKTAPKTEVFEDPD
jgi:hypothetical protein